MKSTLVRQISTARSRRRHRDTTARGLVIARQRGMLLEGPGAPHRALGGLLFLAYYVAYTTFLILAATEHDALPVFSGVMLWGVIPLTALTLAVVVWRQLAARRATLAAGARAGG